MSLISFLRKIYIGFFSLRSSIRNELLWRRAIRDCRARIKPNQSISLNEDTQCLILMPHSDDEWIGCSKIMNSWKNVTVCNMNMPGGDSDIIHKERYLECYSLSKALNCSFITLGDNKIESLTTYIVKNDPNMILLPFFVDWHEEHIEVMAILNKTLEQIDFKGVIMMFQVSVPIPTAECNYSIPMSKKDVRFKWDTFRKYYKTQTCIPVSRFIANERINGGITSSYAAEVYCMVDVDKWKRLYKKMQLSDEERKALLDNLDYLPVIRSISESYYSMKINS